MRNIKHKLTIFLLLFAGIASTLPAQNSNQRLQVALDASTFFYDAEYATPLAEGYTVTGVRLSPTLKINLAQCAWLGIGFNGVVFAGLDSLYMLRPTLSISYSPTRWLTVLGGTIDNEHRLPAALEDPANEFFQYQEDGLQIKTHTAFWQSDTWLNWEHYLTPNTPDQERFTMGSHHNFKVIQKPRFSMQGSLLSLARHRGGELKTIDTNSVTNFNHRFAVDLAYTGNNSTLSINMPLYLYHLEDKVLDNPGYALHPTLFYRYEFRHHEPETQNSASDNNRNRTTSLAAGAGYWYGNHFFCSEGAPQFWSANSYTALHIPLSDELSNVSDIRRLITFAAALQHDFHSLSLALSLNLYHDIDLHKNDLTVAFTMNFSDTFHRR